MTMNYTGYVDGIDVIATSGQPLRCLAFITRQPGGTDSIQVETEAHALQTALELACSKGVEVEVDYDETGGPNVLRRVRLLDR